MQILNNWTSREVPWLQFLGGVCVCLIYILPLALLPVYLCFNMKVQTKEDIGKLCWKRACRLRLIIFKLFDFRAPLHSSQLSRTQKKKMLLIPITVYRIWNYWICLKDSPSGVNGKESACQSRKRETQVPSLGQGDHLEMAMATHSNVLAWEIRWTEEPGGLQSMVSQRVGYDWATKPDLYK